MKLWLADYLLSSPLLLLLLSFVPVPAVCFLLPADFEMTKETTMKMSVYCGYRLLSLFFVFAWIKRWQGQSILVCVYAALFLPCSVCYFFLYVCAPLYFFSSVSPLPVFSFFSLSPAFEKMVMLTLFLWVFLLRLSLFFFVSVPCVIRLPLPGSWPVCPSLFSRFFLWVLLEFFFLPCSGFFFPFYRDPAACLQPVLPLQDCYLPRTRSWARDVVHDWICCRFSGLRLNRDEDHTTVPPATATFRPKDTFSF